MMDTFTKVITNICMIGMIFSSITLLIGSAIFEHKFLKEQKENREKAEKLINKRAEEIEDCIGKELTETKKENERLKKLCDRTLAAAEEQDKAIKQLLEENERLKTRKVKTAKK